MFDGLGFKVYVLDSVEKIGEVLDEIEFIWLLRSY